MQGREKIVKSEAPTMNYPKKTGFIQLRHCAATYSVKTWFLKNLSLYIWGIPPGFLTFCMYQSYFLNTYMKSTLLCLLLAPYPPNSKFHVISCMYEFIRFNLHEILLVFIYQINLSLLFKFPKLKFLETSLFRFSFSFFFQSSKS